MAQTIINQQELVEVVPFEGSLLFGIIPVPWREQPVPVIVGFSQEVFHDQTYTYIGSVNSSSSQIVHARRGDVIYRVSLAPHPASFKGTVVTTDGYQRVYEAHFDLVVRDAKRSVEQYRNGVDLITSAINILRKGTEHFLQQYTHDQINHTGLKIDSYNTILKNEYGLAFMNFKWVAQANARRTSEIEAQQKAEQRKRELDTDVAAKIYEFQKEAEWRKAELRINADVKHLAERIKRGQESEQKQYERDEKVWHSNHLRQEKMKSQLNEARIKLLNKAVDDLIRINSERMQDAFDSNASARGILEDSLRLIGVFDQPADDNMVSSSFPTFDSTIELEESENPETEEIETDISSTQHSQTSRSS